MENLIVNQSNKPIIFSITEETADPEHNRQMALYRRNAEWISEHWALLNDERYRGHVVAVSQGEIFVADSREEARRLALGKHPDDEPFVKFIPQERYERIYAS